MSSIDYQRGWLSGLQREVCFIKRDQWMQWISIEPQRSSRGEQRGPVDQRIEEDGGKWQRGEEALSVRLSTKF